MEGDKLHRNNCITYAMQGILFAVGFVFFDTSGILPRFVKEISGSDILAGAPQMVRLISTTLLQVLTIGYIRRIKNVRRYLTFFMFVSYLAPIVVIATLLLNATGAVIMVGLFVSLLIMWCADGCMVISYYAVFSRTVHAKTRSTVSGVMQTAGGIGGIGSSLVIKVLLDNGSIPDKLGYALIFIIGLIVLALAATAFSFTKDVRPELRERSEATLKSEFKKLGSVLKKNKTYVLILITQAFFTISELRHHVGRAYPRSVRKKARKRVSRIVLQRLRADLRGVFRRVRSGASGILLDVGGHFRHRRDHDLFVGRFLQCDHRRVGGKRGDGFYAGKQHPDLGFVFGHGGRRHDHHLCGIYGRFHVGARVCRDRDCVFGLCYVFHEKKERREAKQ